MEDRVLCLLWIVLIMAFVVGWHILAGAQARRNERIMVEIMKGRELSD